MYNVGKYKNLFRRGLENMQQTKIEGRGNKMYIIS